MKSWKRSRLRKDLALREKEMRQREQISQQKQSVYNKIEEVLVYSFHQFNRLRLAKLYRLLRDESYHTITDYDTQY